MKTNTAVTIAAAAFGGLMIGTAGRTYAAAPAGSSGSSVIAPGHSGTTAASSNIAGTKASNVDDMNMGKHDCKGKNDCKGQGGCKSSDSGCKGKNTCKGKGGCSTK